MSFKAPIILPFGTEILYDPSFGLYGNRIVEPNSKPNCTQQGVILSYFEDSGSYEIVGLLASIKGISEKIPHKAVKISKFGPNNKDKKQKHKTYVRKTYVEIPINKRIMFDPFYDNNILNREENIPNPLLYGFIQDYNAKTKFYTVCILISNTVMEVSRDAISEAGADYEFVLKQKAVIPIMISIAAIILILFTIIYIIF